MDLTVRDYTKPSSAMKTSPRDAGKSADVQSLKLTIASKHATRHADLTKKRAQMAKATLKTAKRAFKLARKIAKKAAKKARRIEEELGAWLKRAEGKPATRRKLKSRKPVKPASGSTRRRKARRKSSKPPAAAVTPPLIPPASVPYPMP